MSEYKVGDVIDNYQLGDIVDKPIYGETYIMIQKQGSHALGMKKVIYYALYDDNDVFIPTKRYNYNNNNFEDVVNFNSSDSLKSVNYVVHAIVKPTGGKSKRRKQKGKFKTRRKFNKKRKQRTSKISSQRV